jgi:hypothetical protein
MHEFFPLAVIGPVPGPRLGLGRACVQCAARLVAGRLCGGFGAGCIGAPRSLPASGQLASSRITA